ncbi:DUF7511 domain-containing protein [Natronomonas salina]|uniref:DUF7511 domain-containing protein n=1 Tax=Natronomonas salina TaxID=1710540 RepID=UPI001FE74932|nr:hypothetical protein [Natronomonas salina]
MTGNHGVRGATMHLRATVVEYEDGPDECTIYPNGVSGAERMTTWISAKEGSFVDLETVI